MHNKTGVLITTGDELLAWIAAAPAEAVASLGIVQCFYPNAVDDAVRVKAANAEREQDEEPQR